MERHGNRLRMLAEQTRIRDSHKADSASRKQFLLLSLILKSYCRNIASQIDESIQVSIDLSEQQ